MRNNNFYAITFSLLLEGIIDKLEVLIEGDEALEVSFFADVKVDEFEKIVKHFTEKDITPSTISLCTRLTREQCRMLGEYLLSAAKVPGLE